MKRIESVWMAVSVDPVDQTEGVCSVLMRDHWMPLIAADELRLIDIRKQAQFIADRTGQAVRLIRLTVRDEVDTFEPREMR